MNQYLRCILFVKKITSSEKTAKAIRTNCTYHKFIFTNELLVKRCLFYYGLHLKGNTFRSTKIVQIILNKFPISIPIENIFYFEFE